MAVVLSGKVLMFARKRGLSTKVLNNLTQPVICPQMWPPCNLPTTEQPLHQKGQVSLNDSGTNLQHQLLEVLLPQKEHPLDQVFPKHG